MPVRSLSHLLLVHRTSPPTQSPQYEGECWCGNERGGGKYVKKPDGECGAVDEAKFKGRGGSGWRNAVYRTGGGDETQENNVEQCQRLDAYNVDGKRVPTETMCVPSQSNILPVVDPEENWGGNGLSASNRFQTGVRPVSDQCLLPHSHSPSSPPCTVHVTVSYVRSAESCRICGVSHPNAQCLTPMHSLDRIIHEN